MKNLLLLLSIYLFSSQLLQAQDIFLGQGIMSGEATSSSIILQSRLTEIATFTNGDLKGVSGIGRFEVALDSTFQNIKITTNWIEAIPENDYLIKTQLEGLTAGKQYYYRLQFGKNKNDIQTSETASFRTLYGAEKDGDISIAITTCINYYFFKYGKYNRSKAYSGKDVALGYPALEVIKDLQPDYFIGNGDNVYFDHPTSKQFQRALKNGKNPHPGDFEGKEVTDEAGMRRKYHQQFSLPRFHEVFKNTATYWTKDDHDYRANDADTVMKFPISHKLGVSNFKEQLPVTNPKNSNDKTYRTRRLNKDVQLWFLEGRDYRSPNRKLDGPDKTMLGAAQLDWLKSTLLASDATFKLIISPTPIVGPDDGYKNDNLVNEKGFKHEGEALMQWIKDNGLLKQHLYWVNGDRHWQYHSKHPSGLEEFCSGALDDNNARKGRLAGDPKSSDPKGLIKQFYIQADAKSVTGGFLLIKVAKKKHKPLLLFQYFDDEGKLLYEVTKKGKK